MPNKIKITVVGMASEKSQSGCLVGDKSSGCSSHCGHNCSGCGSASGSDKTIKDLYEEMVGTILKSELGSFVDFNFVDIYKDSLEGYDEVVDLMKDGFNYPFVIVDGVIRFYGGISVKLIYNDVKELLA